MKRVDDSFDFAEGYDLCLGAKANVLFVDWQ